MVDKIRRLSPFAIPTQHIISKLFTLLQAKIYQNLPIDSSDYYRICPQVKPANQLNSKELTRLAVN